MPTTKETVLVLDDEPNVVDLARRVLHREFRLITAESGTEALQKAAGQEIAVALVDQRMPEMTGLEFLIEFQKTHSHTGIVTITAYTDLEDIVALINRGRINVSTVS